VIFLVALCSGDWPQRIIDQVANSYSGWVTPRDEGGLLK
jgi:hypothetical protein